MKRSGTAVAMAAALVLCPAAAAAEPLRAFVSAPEQVDPGATFRIEALVLNGGDAPVTVTYQLKLTGLSVEKPIERQVWIARRSFLPIRWEAKAGAAGAAGVSLGIDGKVAAEQSVGVAAAVPLPALARRGMLSAEPFEVEAPEAGTAVTAELELTAGAAGELRAALEGLRSVRGLDADALVGRGIVPAALGRYGIGPELEILGAVQDSSGGWGATLAAAPDVRTTSWVVFWLGQLAKRGGHVDAAMRDAALGFLRRRLAGADAGMRARALAALAAHGAAQEKELASLSEKDAAALTMAERLLAASAGANVPLPLKAAWAGLSELEMAALVCSLPENRVGAESATLLRQLAARRGAGPRAGTHGAALGALALARIAGLSAPVKGRVVISVDGKSLDSVELDAANPRVRRTVPLPAAAGRKGKLSVSTTAGPGVFCRVLVRPAK